MCCNILLRTAARSPKQWRDSLANFYTNVYSKEQQTGGGEKKEGEGGGGGEEEGEKQE